jgi:hypothetical protein
VLYEEVQYEEWVQELSPRLVRAGSGRGGIFAQPPAKLRLVPTLVLRLALERIPAARVDDPETLAAQQLVLLSELSEAVATLKEAVETEKARARRSETEAARAERRARLGTVIGVVGMATGIVGAVAAVAAL